MKSVSFYLERFQRYDVLKNLQLLWATLYNKVFVFVVKNVQKRCFFEQGHSESNKLMQAS